jgi:hypothetical protein
MVQGLSARVPAQAGVWVEAKAKVEAEWADHSPQARAEVVSAQTAGKRLLTLLDSRVMQKAVLNVVQK